MRLRLSTLWLGLILVAPGCHQLRSGSTALIELSPRPELRTAEREDRGGAEAIALSPGALPATASSPFTDPDLSLIDTSVGASTDEPDERSQSNLDVMLAVSDSLEAQLDATRIQPVGGETMDRGPAVTLSTIISEGHSIDEPFSSSEVGRAGQVSGEPALLIPPARSFDPPPAVSADKPRSSIVRRLTPLVTPGSWLAAPEPVTERGAADEPAPVEPEHRRHLMASVLGAFGMGTESDSQQIDAMAVPPETPPIDATSDSLDPELVFPPARDDSASLESLRSIEMLFWQEELDKLIALLEAEITHGHPGDTAAERERYVRQQIALRMLYLIASRRSEALQAIPGLEPDQQRFWTQFFWSLANYFDEDAIPDREERATQTLAQLTDAVRLLGPQARLELHAVNFCHRIDGFGDFAPYDEDQFQAGQPVLIYAEVRNFASQSTSTGEYRTLLQSTVDVLEEDLDGPMVYHHELPQTEDHCRTRRQDYFHSYRIQLPTTLSRGPHVLRLTMRDELTGKTASAALNFVVQ